MQADYTGYLLKEASGLVRSSKKRWFVLKGTKLYYYQTKEICDKEAKPAGCIRLDNAKVTDRPGTRFCVSNSDLGRALNLHAEDMTAKAEWLEAFRAALEKEREPKQTEETTPADAMGAEAVISKDLQSRKVALTDFKVLKVIGRGSFGKVMRVEYQNPQGGREVYAMKALRKDVLKQENMVQNAKAEKNILQNIHHPFIVRLHFAFQTPERLYLVLDLLPGGELFFHLSKNGRFSPRRSRQYAAEIASALQHLHKQGIVYRDLKPENIVLDDRGHACLTDMGLAKSEMDSDQQTYTFCGTPEYIAPEILVGTGHNKGVDWWALGILIYEMLCGLPPFYSQVQSEMYDLILKKQLTFPPHVTSETKDLISRLLVRDPSKRLVDGEAILAHKYFAPIDFEKLLAKEIEPEWCPKFGSDLERYVDPQFKEQPTQATVYRSKQAGDKDKDFQGFTFQNSA